jgi:hypothetical protein
MTIKIADTVRLYSGGLTGTVISAWKDIHEEAFLVQLSTGEWVTLPSKELQIVHPS